MTWHCEGVRLKVIQAILVTGIFFESALLVCGAAPAASHLEGNPPSVEEPIRPVLEKDHWAFKPVQNPAVPKVKDRRWARDPVDSFVLAGLEERKLKPVAMADKRTLIRRATFDLTGLPPTPEEIDGFLADPTAGAFSRVVDRLLNSPHFGERWGRHWLDVVRYADSNGLEVNLPFPNAWRYRDYVIGAFNNDKPFDAFIREQLAGDLLPFTSDAQRFEQLIATGFLVLGPKALGEPNPAKLTMDVVDEQIDVTTRSFLGLTASCARCHDHKFDPIPTREYYALAGIFKSTTTLSSAAIPNPQFPRWMERPLATASEARQIEEHTSTLDRLLSELRSLRENPGGLLSKNLPGIVVDNTAARLTGRWKDSVGSTNFVDKNYQHDANSDKGKMTARFIPNLPHTGLYEVLVSYTPAPNRATNVPVTIEHAQGKTSYPVDQRATPNFRNAFVTVGSYPFETGTNHSVLISNEGTQGFVTIDAAQFVPIDEWKLELENLQSDAMAMAAGAGTMPASGPPLGQAAVQMAAFNPTMSGRPAEDLQRRIVELRGKAPAPAPMAMAVQEGTVSNCRVHIRGEIGKLGPEIPRDVFSVLKSGRAPEFNQKSSGRLELADWIASETNPLTARVAVNRIWLHLFGRGLVDSPDNFGVLGERPTHPELLDHLAWRFASNNGSVKQMIRSLMLTATYQLGSGHDPEAFRKDPENRFYWRMNRRRLEAEPIRDAMLALSGNLDRTPGGSFTMTNSINELTLQESAAPPSNRRSVYLPVIRNNILDLFQVFDFGDPHAITGKRHVTSAATQALFMLNSQFVQEQSSAWARRLVQTNLDDSARIDLAYQQCFGRRPDRGETQRALDFLAATFRDAPAPAPERAVAGWQLFCQALLASTEFRFID